MTHALHSSASNGKLPSSPLCEACRRDRDMVSGLIADNGLFGSRHDYSCHHMRLPSRRLGTKCSLTGCLTYKLIMGLF